VVVVVTVVLPSGTGGATPVVSAQPSTEAIVVQPTPAAVVPGMWVNVTEIPSGESRPGGTLVVLRIVNHNAHSINVMGGPLAQDTQFGPLGNGLVHDGWEGHLTVSRALSDACREAQARVADSKTPGSWCFGYQVSYLGGPVPAVCN
jgi:hypothetical protein